MADCHRTLIFAVSVQLPCIRTGSVQYTGSIIRKHAVNLDLERDTVIFWVVELGL